MEKKVLIPVVIGALVGLIGTGAYLLYARNASFGFPTLRQETVPTDFSSDGQEQPAELSTWTDPAGFTFRYPKGLSVNKHDEDKDNYAHVEFTSNDHPGNIIVWAKDTAASDINAWVKVDKRFVNANILDTTLGGKLAKKILIATPSAMLITGAIDEGIVFTVEASLGNDTFWSKIHDMMSGSFSFTPLAGANGDTTSVSDEAVDEEEVIE